MIYLILFITLLLIVLLLLKRKPGRKRAYGTAGLDFLTLVLELINLFIP